MARRESREERMRQRGNGKGGGRRCAHTKECINANELTNSGNSHNMCDSMCLCLCVCVRLCVCVCVCLYI